MSWSWQRSLSSTPARFGRFVWLLGDMLLLIVRLLLIRACQNGRPLGATGPIDALLATGLLWTFDMGLGCAACAMTTDILLVALAAIHVTRNQCRHCGAQCRCFLGSRRYRSCSAVYPFHCRRNDAPLPQPLDTGARDACFMAAMCSVLQRQYCDTIALIRAERQNTFLAFHDALTGLPNRVRFNEQLLCILKETPSSLLERHQTAVLYLDLDGFKAINGLYRCTPQATRCCARYRARPISGHAEKASASRMGGDEFAIF